MNTLLLLAGMVGYTEVPGNLSGPPYVLATPRETYVLSQNINASTTAIQIKAPNVILDLNGHTITCDQIGGGVPNSGFEEAGASPHQPIGWDLSLAPGASRESTYNNAVNGGWYLKLAESGQDQTIVSDWTDLRPNKDAVVHFIRDVLPHNGHVLMKIEAEHETLGVVAGRYSHSNFLQVFETPSEPGRYRVRLSLIDQAKPTWQPNTEYAIGDLVRPSSPNGGFYMLERIGDISSGISGLDEPAWSTTLGGITQDGNLQWVTSIKRQKWPSRDWQPGKEYSLGATVSSTGDDGFAYTLSRIRVPGVTSGDVEPVWTRPPTSRRAADGDLSWKAWADTDARVDLVDVRSAYIHGIYSYGQSNITIKNGEIVQGVGGSYQSHAVRVQAQKNVTIRDLKISTNGLESSAILATYSAGVTVRNNTVTTATSHKFNRHQLSAAVMVMGDDATIENNTVDSGEGWGGIFVTGANGIVQNNTVATHSVITNHYGIMAYGADHLVKSNVVKADPGQGLRLHGERNIADDNDITISSVSPNWDINWLSLDGIRINDYNTSNEAKKAKDNLVRNNRITLYGRHSSRYEPHAQILNGISNRTNGAGNAYEGNTITAVKVDPEIIVSGIQPGSKDELVVWRGNTIVSDQYGIMFGAYPEWSFNTRFENTRFVKGSNAGADYAVLMGRPRTKADYVNNTVLYNTILDGGGTLRWIDGPTYTPASYLVSSPLDVTIQDTTGNLLAGADVTITNARGETVFEGVTGADGLVEISELPAYRVRCPSGEWICSEDGPYTITVTYRDTTADPKVVDLDNSRAVRIVLDGKN